MERLLSTEELAQYLALPLGTIYSWHTRSTGPEAIRVGKHLRYRESAVMEWLDRQTDKARNPGPPRTAAATRQAAENARARREANETGRARRAA